METAGWPYLSTGFSTIKYHDLTVTCAIRELYCAYALTVPGLNDQYDRTVLLENQRTNQALRACIPISLAIHLI